MRASPAKRDHLRQRVYLLHGVSGEPRPHRDLLARMRSAVQFACAKCGSPAVSIPAELSATATVQCARCGHVLGTWAELQAFARERIAAQPDRTGTSADPLGDNPAVVRADGGRRTASSKVVARLARAVRELTHSYHPEKHYMRGPGPKSHERRDCSRPDRPDAGGRFTGDN